MPPGDRTGSVSGTQLTFKVVQAFRDGAVKEDALRPAKWGQQNSALVVAVGEALVDEVGKMSQAKQCSGGGGG